MGKSRLFYEKQELTAYPIGGRRVWLLFIVILANFIAAYEAQISPVVPMLLDGLKMTLGEYGLISCASVIAAAISAMIFGPIADRHGRVRFLVPSLFLTAVCVFLMSTVDTVMGLLWVRVLLGLVEGVSISTTAGLVRDFSPRMGRALAYGFWTFGPVGSNFFANALAAWTLPIFLTWESQFIIQGAIALVSSILILFNIRDLSPELRSHVISNLDQVEKVNKVVQHAKKDQNEKAGEMLRVPRIWALSIGISLFLLTYLTIQSFGTTLLVQAFGYDNAEAASIAQYFWTLNLITLLIAGWISDKLRLRKIISLIGAILSLAYTMYFATLVGTDISEGQLIVATSLLGGFMGIAYGPWMALFSENAEDIKASLQASAWGLWGFIIRVVGIAMVLIVPVVVGGSGWDAWLWVCAIGGLVYIPLIFTAKGPWFRGSLSEEAVPPPEVIG
ncbi:MFS transporter [Neobacillus sp. Marseille-QA0830]